MPSSLFSNDIFPRRRMGPGVLSSLNPSSPSYASATVPAYTLTAVNCPAVQEGISSTLLTLTDAALGDGNAPSGRSMVREVPWRQNTYNPNLLASELMGRYGGGGAYFIAKGLTLYNAGGLNIGIAAGHAVASTIIPYAGGTKVCTDSISGTPTRNWIWLSQAGTIAAQPNTLSPPAGAQVLLGSCVTSGGVIVAIDTSGVLYARGNRLVRYVADITTPTDVPSNLVRYINRNPFTYQEWEWTGSEYITIPSPYNALKVAEGGTGATTAAAARSALGIAVGSSVEAWSAVLDALASVMSATATAAAQRTALGLGSAATHASSDFVLTTVNVPYILSVVDGGAAFLWPSPTPEVTIIYCDATGGNINSSELPALPTFPWTGEIRVVKTDASANTVTITAGGGQTINGAGTKVLSTQWESVILSNDNSSQWFIF